MRSKLPQEVVATSSQDGAHLDEKEKTSSFAEILKSTSLMGASSAANIIIGILRMKVMAVLLGPSGIGLMGMFMAISDLMRSVAAMGVNNSGVRQIAEAVATNDHAKVSQTATALRWTGIILGLIGASMVVVFSGFISSVAFGDKKHSVAIAWLSLAVFFRLLSDAYGALIQGMRRITDLAKISVIGALGGALASCVLVAFYGESGVMPSLVVAAVVSATASWHYSRAIRINPCKLTRNQLYSEASSLLKLGTAFMVSSFLMMGTVFVVKLIVIRTEGVEAAGLYQAAWTLGGLYVGFVLQAMGSDFYPRLVGSIEDKQRVGQLVNEQTLVGMVLAGPGMLATFVLAPQILSGFYTEEFRRAVDLLRWICLGMALRVVMWPVGYVIVAANRRMIFFVTELAWATLNILMSWAFVVGHGVSGAGMAFLGSYICHGLLIAIIVRRSFAFRWSAETIRMGIVFLSSFALVIAADLLLTPLLAMIGSVLILLVNSWYSTRMLLSIVSPPHLPKVIRKLLGMRRSGPVQAGFTKSS